MYIDMFIYIHIARRFAIINRPYDTPNYKLEALSNLQYLIQGLARSTWIEALNSVHIYVGSTS